MQRTLLMRLEAPLMSFGGIMIDGNGVTLRHPTLSMLTGLFGNALGYRHGDAESLDRLQSRLRFAARADDHGQPLVDFQTVGLDQDHLQEGWTTRGTREARAGGSAGGGTAIRQRHYVADGVFTVAVQLEDADTAPTIDDLARALDKPFRPLFIGRKPCIPSTRLLLGVVEATTPREAVSMAPWADRAMQGRPNDDTVPIWWSEETEEGRSAAQAGLLVLPIADVRDWSNQVHTGFRWLSESRLTRPLERLSPEGQGEEIGDDHDAN